MSKKAITLWQPWATLVLLGLKRYETRSWPTSYRGPLVIHAAARPVQQEECNPEIIEALQKAGFDSLASLPLGVGLCVVTLADCIPTEEALQFIGGQERAFGNYAVGRFAWKLEDRWPFPKPIQARGFQGLWEWTHEH